MRVLKDMENLFFFIVCVLVFAVLMSIHRKRMRGMYLGYGFRWRPLPRWARVDKRRARVDKLLPVSVTAGSDEVVLCGRYSSGGPVPPELIADGATASFVGRHIRIEKLSDGKSIRLSGLKNAGVTDKPGTKEVNLLNLKRGWVNTLILIVLPTKGTVA